jgi:hypothetical protein
VLMHHIITRWELGDKEEVMKRYYLTVPKGLSLCH